MRNRMVGQVCLAMLLLSGFLINTEVRAQQAKPPATSAKKPASPPASPAISPVPGVTSASEKVVMKVGPAQVTQSEMEILISSLNQQDQQALAAQGKRVLGERYLDVLMLSQQAVNDHLDSTQTVRERLELTRVQMLAEMEYQKMASETKITPEEVGQYFTAHQSDYDTVQARQFVVRKKPAGAKEGTPGLTEEEAKAKAEAIRKALVAGTDIKKVIQDFAVPNVVMIDPEPRAVQRGKLLPALEKSAFQLKDGEVSEPVDVPQALVFLQIIGHSHAEQKDVSTEIENTIRQQKLTAEMAELKKKATVWMDEDYFKGPVASTPTLGPKPTATAPTPKP
jgi:parvulin-like peptidyl-prolyl isomerase